MDGGIGIGLRRGVGEADSDGVVDAGGGSDGMGSRAGDELIRLVGPQIGLD